MNVQKVSIPDLENSIYRQRVILEGKYSKEQDGETIRTYMWELSKLLDMRVFAGPYSWPPDVWTFPEVPLHDLNGFVAWTQSGCHVYAWKKQRFFTVDMYSCKPYDTHKVIEFTKDFFGSKQMETVLIESGNKNEGKING